MYIEVSTYSIALKTDMGFQEAFSDVKKSHNCPPGGRFRLSSPVVQNSHCVINVCMLTQERLLSTLVSWIMILLLRLRGLVEKWKYNLYNIDYADSLL